MEEPRIRTRATERLGIRHPILCAPMALVAGGELAAAVTRAGGLGIVGGGYAGALGGEPELEAELVLAKQGKFGMGFITWALERSAKALTAALKHAPFLRLPFVWRCAAVRERDSRGRSALGLPGAVSGANGHGDRGGS